jgi:hypothetical protein
MYAIQCQKVEASPFLWIFYPGKMLKNCQLLLRCIQRQKPKKPKNVFVKDFSFPFLLTDLS